MQNFNTNQTRQLYVAAAIDSSVDTNLDIYMAQATTGGVYFKYKNADGLLTRSDTIDPKKIVSLKKTGKVALQKPLVAHMVSVDTSAVTLSNLVGKTLDCIITVHDAIDYDSTETIVASVVGDSTNTANATAFHKALAMAIAKAVPAHDGYPAITVYSNGSIVEANTAASGVTGASVGVELVEAPQKYVRGKLSGEPCHITIAFRYNSGMEDIVWGKDTVSTVAAVNTAQTYSISPAYISGAYALADLEYFAAGEKGDFYRGSMWPNDYSFTPAIDLTKEYNVLSIEYFWAGEAENVQKSPRMIQIAAEAKVSDDVVTALYNDLYALTPDGINAGVEARLEALEGASN